MNSPWRHIFGRRPDLFTGIIEELGAVSQIRSGRLVVACRKVLEDLTEGSSIAVNGVCLTALAPRDGSFSADLAPETMRRSSLGDLAPGSRVNLERPLLAAGRLHGHIVQGHVDGTGELLSLDPLGNGNWWLKVRIPADLERYLVFKGSIAIDGISLTVAELDGGIVSVTIIPHTYESTTLATHRSGDRVNLECDVLARYVEQAVRNFLSMSENGE